MAVNITVSGNNYTVEAGSAEAGNGGNITLVGGDGGGSGGDIVIVGGQSEAGQGGNVTITAPNGATGGRMKLATGEGTNGRGGDIFIQPGPGSESGGNLQVELLNGQLVIYGLPTSNPNVENALWNDAGLLKISAG